MENARLTRYGEFWPHYVGAHRKVGTRLLHFAGTSAALGCLAAAGLWSEPRLIVAAPVSGYGLAWLGHVLVERNRPATFSHPVCSLIGDFHMYGLMWCGLMGREIARLSEQERSHFEFPSA